MEKSNNSADVKKTGLRERTDSRRKQGTGLKKSDSSAEEKRTDLRERIDRSQQARDHPQRKSNRSADEKRTGLRARTDRRWQEKDRLQNNNRSKSANKGPTSKKKQRFSLRKATVQP